MTNDFITISLDDVHGGGARLAYDTGRVAGRVVTAVIAPFNPDLAFTQTGGPWLRRQGFPNAAAGAEQGVRDIAAQYNHPVTG